MILFHGSNREIIKPSLEFSRSSLDFGTGFYTTSDFEQAKKWALRKVSVRKTGSPTVSVFETSEPSWSVLSVLEFKNADLNWLNLVSGYRARRIVTELHDVITGPVADDRTIDVINQYLAGVYTADIALKLLEPMRFTDQWAIKTISAIAALHFKESLPV